MAFCSKCGATVNDGPGFCGQCGAALGQASAPQYGGPVPNYGAPPAASGLQENVAGMLCYLAGWLTGIIFLLIDKRPSVRFNAAQSIVVFGVLHILQIVLAFGFFTSGALWSLHWAISSLIGLLTFVAWIVLMLMTYQGKQVEIPVVAGIAHSIAGKV